ncbi:STAS domain-containing protein [Aurantibacillus circumpalustris]|uniref:STAS domain-containing protein n=1 Tax=Aurantibacillus circumpalustris TaxID=3036359 RepID=UPI00295A6813|nr:STAS domain-containing protein [Aurantibacillus circumpalustris]
MVFDFTISKQGNYAIISMNGNLIEKGQAIALLEKAEELTKEGCSQWIIDLEKLIYMNSSGLNTLIQLLTKARVAGGEAVLFNMNKKINELILITKLHTLFKVAGSKSEAVEILGL